MPWLSLNTIFRLISSFPALRFRLPHDDWRFWLAIGRIKSFPSRTFKQVYFDVGSDVKEIRLSDSIDCGSRPG